MSIKKTEFSIIIYRRPDDTLRSVADTVLNNGREWFVSVTARYSMIHEHVELVNMFSNTAPTNFELPFTSRLASYRYINRHCHCVRAPSSRSHRVTKSYENIASDFISYLGCVLDLSQ